MSITVQGKVERQGFGPGTWALVTTDQTYELKNAPPELQKTGIMAEVTGEIRRDMMTLAMIGPVLAVESFNLLS
ncbi:MAG: hypothetical protein HC835_03490 [Oscillatoriales cyanobacterium RM2_1_1]|nr:hypothetical protein [Oscillatoriales cyanobacterium SM2_3_0]NJO44756.1 hypothetical protein [Oscillatoriales cyanobacterium RM2_1_1]